MCNNYIKKIIVRFVIIKKTKEKLLLYKKSIVKFGIIKKKIILNKSNKL